MMRIRETEYHELGGREYEKLLGLQSLVVVFSCEIVEQNHGFANTIMKHVLKVSYALMLPTT